MSPLICCHKMSENVLMSLKQPVLFIDMGDGVKQCCLLFSDLVPFNFLSSQPSLPPLSKKVSTYKCHLIYITVNVTIRVVEMLICFILVIEM